MTDAALVFPAVFGLASVLARRGVVVASPLALIAVARALAAVPVVFVSAAAVFVLVAPAAARAVAVASGLAPIVAEHGLAAASVAFVSAVPVFALVAAVAERALAVASDLALIVVARALAAASVAAVVVVVGAFLADRAFALFALPAFVAARWSACSFPPRTWCLLQAP